MNITVLFWLGFTLVILGILGWADIFNFCTARRSVIIGKGFIITGGVLAGLMLFARMVLWTVAQGGSI